MQLSLVDRSLRPAGELEVADSLFARAWNGPLVHRLVTAHAANARAGTSKQKSRSEVKHTTSRLYRQKGTGRARAGMSSSPVRKGGGRAFPATPSDNHRKGINRKEFRAGMAALLSRLARDGALFVAEEIAAEQAKTKPCAAMIREFGGEGRVLFVDTKLDRHFELSSRNVRRVRLAELDRLLSTDLVRTDRVVLSRRAVEEMQRKWS